MAFIRKRRSWDSQPQEVAQPNPAWADGLIWLWNGAHQLAAHGGDLSFLGAVPDLVVTSSGVGYKNTAISSNQKLLLPDLSSLISATNEVTLVLILSGGNNTTQGLANIGGTNDTTQSDHYPYRPASTDLIYSSLFKSNRWVSGVTSKVDHTQPHVVAVQFKNGLQRYTQAGIQLTTATNAVNPIWPSWARLLVSDHTGYAYSGAIVGAAVFNRYVPDAKLYEITKSVKDAWQLFAPRSIPIPVSSGGGTTINGALGTATASGFPATVNANRAVAASLGTVAASGFQASVTQNATIEGNLGVAAASGFLATVNASTIIAASPGVVAASGFQATVANSFDTTVNGSLGTAVASGFTAGISANTTIAGSLGVAAALGFQATVDNSSNTVIDGALGVVVASGFTAGINASTIVAASSGVVEALGFQASITANGAVTISVVQPYITVYFWKRVS